MELKRLVDYPDVCFLKQLHDCHQVLFLNLGSFINKI